MRRRSATIVGLAVALVGCTGSWLELRVANRSDERVEVAVSRWVDVDLPPDAFTGLAVEVGPGEDRMIATEGTKPDRWTILVNREPVTDSLQWPDDNPTLDFSIVVDADGRVALIDD